MVKYENVEFNKFFYVVKSENVTLVKKYYNN